MFVFKIHRLQREANSAEIVVLTFSDKKDTDEPVKAKPKFDINEQPVVDEEEEQPGDVQDCWPAFCYKKSW